MNWRERTFLVACVACSVLAFAGAPAVRAQGSHAPVKSCSDLVHVRIPGTAMTITTAVSVPAAPAGSVSLTPYPTKSRFPSPAYSRADGEMDPRTGGDGKHDAIGVASTLTDEWNGRCL